MDVRRFIWALALLVAGAVGWKVLSGETVQGWWASATHRPAEIKFDNGSVREFAAASAPDPASAPPLPAGTMRKCRKGKETHYTTSPCPPGMTEQALSSGTFSVVGSPAPQPPAGGTSAPRRLVDQMMDAQMNGR
jgi:hypothetical protein